MSRLAPWIPWVFTRSLRQMTSYTTWRHGNRSMCIGKIPWRFNNTTAEHTTSSSTEYRWKSDKGTCLKYLVQLANLLLQQTPYPTKCTIIYLHHTIEACMGVRLSRLKVPMIFYCNKAYFSPDNHCTWKYYSVQLKPTQRMKWDQFNTATHDDLENLRFARIAESCQKKIEYCSQPTAWRETSDLKQWRSMTALYVWSNVRHNG